MFDRNCPSKQRPGLDAKIWSVMTGTEPNSSKEHRRRGRPSSKQKKSDISGVQSPRQRIARKPASPVSRQKKEETSSKLNLDEQRAYITYLVDTRRPQKDIYRRVLELREATIEDDVRRWQITQAIFEDALLRLDPEHLGLCILYARLMPPREDGIHSLYELEMRGSYPWPFTLESKAYLGSTTLAGTAAMLQHMQRWDDLDSDGRLQIMADDLERSACAQPLMLAGRMAGVLVVSSTQPGFFIDSTVCQSVIEYARLLTLALNDHDFYPSSQLCLKPMPDLKWQRAEMSRSYVNRVIACAHKENLSFAGAEEHVRREMEAEFERSESRRQEEARSADELRSTV
jgi:hypothetical protein